MARWQGVWRSNPRDPQEPVAVGARSAGRGEGGRDLRPPAGTISFVNGFWTVSGAGHLYLDGEEFAVCEGDLFIYLPGQHVRVEAEGTGWSYRWFTADGPLAVAVLSALGLEGEWPKAAGRCPVELFDELEEAISDVARGAEQRAGAALFTLLSLAARRVGRRGIRSGVVERCRDCIEDRFTDPFLDICGLAGELRVHRSQLTRMFHAEIGLPPGVYLQRLRLRHALRLLRETEMSIKEVAHASGFRDASYFVRRIRQVTGCTPRQFRTRL